jgi:hypothetical protein
MFSAHHFVIALMDKLEKGYFSGVQVDFGTTGPYYESQKGPNWFQYYYCPIDYVHPNCRDNLLEKKFSNVDYGRLTDYVEGVFGFDDTGMPRERARELIDKYLILKPEIKYEIEQFAKLHFTPDDYVIGVHYRGTDKACNDIARCEARRVTYQEMVSRITEQVQEALDRGIKAIKIFACSDEQGFIDHLDDKFPGQVVTTQSKRSTDGIPLHGGLHLKAKEPYQGGKEALIDAHLLGKLSHILLRTSSNLSAFASFLLRAGAKVIQVSKRMHYDRPLNGTNNSL